MELSDREAIQLRAILDLKDKGWDETDIRRLLNFSERTLYRRMAKERVMRRRGRPQAIVLPAAVAC